MPRRSDAHRITPERRRLFLEGIALGKTHTQAARELGVDRRSFYSYRDPDDPLYDPEFAAGFEEAQAAGTAALIEAARQRAVDGTEEPVVSAGKLLGYRKAYSDRLLEFLIKQRDPSFRDNSRLEVTGAGGGPVTVEQRGVSLADVAHVLQAAGALDAIVSGGTPRAALPAASPVLPEPEQR